MGVEELGLRLATIAALAIPPTTAVTVEIGAVGSGDSDVGSGDGDKGSAPFLVTKRGFAFEDDLSTLIVRIARRGTVTYVSPIIQIGQIQSGT